MDKHGVGASIRDLEAKHLLWWGVHNDDHQEKYDVTVERDPATNIPKWITTRLDGHLHSLPDDRPAQVVFDAEGRVCQMAWCVAGLYHRECGPALIRIDPKTSIHVYEEYRRHGRVHRSVSEPAVIERDPTSGAVIAERYYVDDEQVCPRAAARRDPRPDF